MTEALVGLWVGLMAAAIAWGITNDRWKNEALERGFATYCPMNGQWAWNGECDK